MNRFRRILLTVAACSIAALFLGTRGLPNFHPEGAASASTASADDAGKCDGCLLAAYTPGAAAAAPVAAAFSMPVDDLAPLPQRALTPDLTPSVTLPSSDLTLTAEAGSTDSFVVLPAPSPPGATVTAPDDVAEGMNAYKLGDFSKARQLLSAHLDQPAAALAYLRAAFQLGELAPADIDLLRKLAVTSAPAARMLGDFYRTGKLAPPDRQQAEAAYQQAIKLGDKRSLLRLAQFYDEADDSRATAAYAAALADFPQQEPRYLYLMAASAGSPPADRSQAAARLGQLATTDVAAARADFDLYRKNDVPGETATQALAAAETAFGLGARELGTYLASSCTTCTPDQVEAYMRASTQLDDTRRVARALSRLANAGKNAEVISILDTMPADKASPIGAPLVAQLGAKSEETLLLVQLRLQAAGLYAGKLDGLTGPGTRAAMQIASKRAGLKVETPELLAWVIAHSLE